MLQRNNTGYAQHVMAWPTDEHPDLEGPFVVGPDEVKDFPKPLAGFVPADEAPDEKPAAPKKATAPAKNEEGEAS